MATTYVGIIKNKLFTTIDGYSSAKTLRGLASDIRKEISKINTLEAELFDVRTNKEVEELYSTPTNDNDWFFVYDEVECACRLNECEEVETKDGYNYYFCVRFVN